MAFSPDGLSRVLAGLAATGRWSIRFDADRSTDYPADEGYPVVFDPDTRNHGRGQHVVTWRVTVPRGTRWDVPARGVYLVDEQGVIMYQTELSAPLGTSPTHPTIFFLNLYFTR